MYKITLSVLLLLLFIYFVFIFHLFLMFVLCRSVSWKWTGEGFYKAVGTDLPPAMTSLWERRQLWRKWRVANAMERRTSARGRGKIFWQEGARRAPEHRALLYTCNVSFI